MMVTIILKDGSTYGPVEPVLKGMDEDGNIAYEIDLPFPPWHFKSAEMDVFPAKSGLVFNFSYPEHPEVIDLSASMRDDTIESTLFKSEGLLVPKKKRWWKR